MFAQIWKKHDDINKRYDWGSIELCGAVHLIQLSSFAFRFTQLFRINVVQVHFAAPLPSPSPVHLEDNLDDNDNKRSLS